jgi:ABC-2 type transport system permease protein
MKHIKYLTNFIEYFTSKFPNFEGMKALISKELIRFCKVPLQTIVAPAVIIIVLYLVISLIHGDTSNGGYVSYQNFLIPGLIAMTAAQK